ncbi:hypothetical protein [Vagococcus salmoninarum]|uniref:hypothetical protein n=1 Tax=Vagococcus salmoninarum TaxID=2739 RepID=UPI001880ACE6|nr:hypothetical protein [Vagococcus salmoninarum]MBE9388846.1 hypothetical protein [Vagococcus salmoninarum]
MHQAMVKIIVDQIISQFKTESQFCASYLEIPLKDWQAWKDGTLVLQGEDMQKIKSLFSDYEWMLMQKIIKQTILFPEKRNYVVLEYKRVKSLVAKKWIRSGEAMVELISQRDSHNKVGMASQRKETINLRVFLDYDLWGYDDILEFCLPAVVQQQIEDSPVDLLEWVNENLTDTYVLDDKN